MVLALVCWVVKLVELNAEEERPWERREEDWFDEYDDA